MPVHAFAQAEDYDSDMRIQRLENQLRTLTGQNEELQFRNRQLEEQLRQVQGTAPATPNAAAPNAAQRAAPNMAAPQNPSYQTPPQNSPYDASQGQPAAGVNGGPPVLTAPVGSSGRRGDAFDPSRNPSAPGVPRALGGGQLPVANAPGGRATGEPLSLSHDNNTGLIDAPAPAGPGAPAGNASAGLTTLPPSQTPRDEFDLGIGYIQRKDYALAEETMRNFTTKYPSDRMVSDAQYWLGESLFQRQRYRDAAESFLAVTTKYDKSGKAPDALLRLGQSLAALKEKEAACAAFGEVTRKYPRAASGVKQGVSREQKRNHC